MPDIGFPETDLTEELSNTPATQREVLYRFWDDAPSEVIGAGAENVVITIDGKPNKVAAISYLHLSPLEAKRQFYLHRIFEVLFPHNFPHFYAAGGSEKTNALTGTIRQKIEENTTQVRYPFKAVEQKCEQYGIPLLNDSDRSNYIVGEDGGEYYVDRLVDDILPHDLATRMMRVMDEQPDRYSQQERELVTRGVTRLKDLGLLQ